MSSAKGMRPRPVPDRALAEAAVWIARLHGPARTGAVESGWSDWFRAHPDHAAAWELISDQWNKSHDIPVGLVHPPVHLPHSHARSRLRWALVTLAAAASVVIGCAALVFARRGIVSTVVGEQRTVNLEDGTRIELNTATRLGVKYSPKARMVELKSGEAYFSVAHEHRPFVVVAGARKVIAVGTSFTVRRDEAADDAMTVTLIEGRVAVAPATAPNVLPAGEMTGVNVLSAGERVRIRGSASITKDAPSMERVTGWMRGQLVFDHTPLGEAVQELNRYSLRRLSLTTAETARIPVSGTFRVSDSVSFAEAAAQTYNLRLVRRGNELVLGPTPNAPSSRE